MNALGQTVGDAAREHAKDSAQEAAVKKLALVFALMAIAPAAVWFGTWKATDGNQLYAAAAGGLMLSFSTLYILLVVDVGDLRRGAKIAAMGQ